MTKSIVAAVSLATLAAAGTFYIYVGHGNNSNSTVEADRQTKWYQAGTFSNIYVRVSANATTTATTVTFRKNAAAGSMTLSIAGGATGEFTEGTPHTDTIAANDKVALQVIVGATSTIAIRATSFVFAPTTTTDTVSKLVTFNSAFTTASSTQYERYNAIPGFGTTESQHQLKWKKAGTLKNLYARATAIRATSSTWRSRKNTANGNMTFNVTGTAPLEFADTANSDVIAVDDLTNNQLVTGTGVDSLTLLTATIDYISTAGDSVFLAGAATAAGDGIAKGVTAFQGLCGNLFTTANTEANVQVTARISAADGTITFSNLSVKIEANTTGVASTVDLRKNSASTAVTISIAGAATGWFHDTTNTETSISATDELNTRIVNADVAGGTHTLTVGQVVLYLNIAAAAVTIPQTVWIEWEE